MPQIEYTGRSFWFAWAGMTFPNMEDGQQIRISTDEHRVRIDLLEQGEIVETRELLVEDLIDIFFGED